MTIKKRLPQAPSTPSPELAEFLKPFRVSFIFEKSFTSLERYLTGLLTEHPNKNCDTIPSVVPGSSEQQLQYLLTDLVWNEATTNRQRIKRMLELESEGDGVLIFDDTGFEKKGKHSVGVARQYSGTAGKVTNCQVAVNCHYAERTLAWPVATRLYLPREWVDDPLRRRAAHVPEEIRFETKAEIALDLLDEANACRVKHACVVSDADYGDNPNFLNGLEARRERCVVAVRADFSVALEAGASSPVERADLAIGAQPKSAWRVIRWTEGQGGSLSASFTALRCWRVDGDGTRHKGWLIGQRPAEDPQGEHKYYWSSFPPRTPLEVMVEYTHRRHWVEQYHEEAKGELGWDQYQGRRWDGFHRHAVTVMLAFSFLVWLEWLKRQKQRKPGFPRA
ncbi:MAG: IS701 family transposase, partial [Acidobacteria bacterium]|nr:IS701 family transposase [Acidobacteriota bacterium]